MREKRILQILGLFLIFFILTNPRTAGTQVRVFFEWLVDLGEAALEFLDNLFADDQSLSAEQVSAERGASTPRSGEEPSSLVAASARSDAAGAGHLLSAVVGRQGPLVPRPP